MKPPKPIICNERQKVIGRWLYVPIELEGYKEGYNSRVQDVYEAAYFYTSSKAVRRCWRWLRRERVYSKPLHDEGVGECLECKTWHEIYPNKPDEILQKRKVI